MSDSSVAVPWGSALWDQQQAIETFTEEGIGFLQVAHEFARKRAAVELEYSRNLSKLVKEYTSKLNTSVEDDESTSAGSLSQTNLNLSPNGGTLSRKTKRFSLRNNQTSAEQISTHKDRSSSATSQMRSWACFLQETGAIAAAHQTASEQIDEKISDPLKTEARNLSNVRKQLIAQAKVFRVDLQRTVEGIEKLRKHAETTARSAEDARATYEKCLLENGSKAAIEKLRIDFDQRASMANKAAEQHLEAMTNLEELRRIHHLEQIPSVLDALQKMERDRILTVGDTMEKFAKILAENALENQRRMEQAGKEVASVDPISILDEFTKQNKSGKPFPVYGESTTAMVLDEMADADESEHALRRANLSRSSGNLGMPPAPDGGASLDSILADDDFFHGASSAESLRQASIRLREVEKAMAETIRTRQAVEALRGIYLRDYAGSMAPAPVTVALTSANAQIAELGKQEGELEIRHQRLSSYLASRYGTKPVQERRSMISILGSLTGQHATTSSKYNTLNSRSGVKSTGVEEDWAASIMKEVAERIGADIPTPRRETLGDMSPSKSHSRNLTSPESPIRPRRVTSVEQYGMGVNKKYAKPISLETSNMLPMHSKLRSDLQRTTAEFVNPEAPDKSKKPLEPIENRTSVSGILSSGGTTVPPTVPSLPPEARLAEKQFAVDADSLGISNIKSETGKLIFLRARFFFVIFPFASSNETSLVFHFSPFELPHYTEVGVSNFVRAVALYAFFAQPNSCELSIEQGDELLLLEREPEGASGWCRVEDATGEEGFVPLSYVSEIIGTQNATFEHA